MLSFTISDHYLKFISAAVHAFDCSRVGTALWEVDVLQLPRLRTQERGGDYTETTYRLLCRECGTVRTHTGEIHTIERGDVGQIGYGRKPSRVGDLWLHAGPTRGTHSADDLGPETFFLSASNAPPDSELAVIAVIGWSREWKGSKWGPVRWWARYGWDEPGNDAPRAEGLTSKRAAVRWVAAQAQPAAAR